MSDRARPEAVLDYIGQNWHQCVRFTREDDGLSLALPHPYTVPCIKGIFNGLFYWDTYFTNLGLLRLGLTDLARNNVDNLLHEAGKYGYVPNANWRPLLNRSQPPFLSMMVRDVYEVTRDEAWLSGAHDILKLEYDFWQRKRMTPAGLNRYYHNAQADPAMLQDFYREVKLRVDIEAETEAERLAIAGHYLSEAESGWDFNPRFAGRCADFIPVDLNSNLYVYEKNFARYSLILGTGEEKAWEARAGRRRDLLDALCWDETRGMYFDYDCRHGTPGRVRSAATLYPLWAGMVPAERARRIARNLDTLECAHGLAACEKHAAPFTYQWDYPNGWPPLQYIAFRGLADYGMTAEAERIAGKYLRVVADNFDLTGDLWEKYNVAEGTTAVVDEYEMPAMMGWTAGVFVAAAEYLGLPVAAPRG